MGGHVHEQGEWMFEYKFAQMYMDQLRVGDQRVTDMAAAYNATGDNFAVLPTNMNMDMHMIHMMYGLTDNVTLYVMPMFMSLTMDHRRGPRTGMDGTFFRTHNEGFADMPLGALWRVFDGEIDEVIVNLGASAPTGNIDVIVPGTTGEFPYPMRLGSGSFSLRPGVTYRLYTEKHSFGAQLQTNLPLYTNYTGYQLGNRYALNFWMTRTIGAARKLAFSFRTEHVWQENIHGQDRDLAMAAANNIVSTVRPDMQGGYWLNLGYGVMYMLPEGSRLNFEMTQPIYQFVDGIQLETDWQLFASWSKAF
jgi:hypothetical protein